MTEVSKETIIHYLKEHKEELQEKYSIEKIGLFGSFSTNNEKSESDIDLLYETSTKGLTFSQSNELEKNLEKIFKKRVDLVHLKYMNPLILRNAIKDIIYV